MKGIYDVLLCLVLSFLMSSVQAMSQPVPKGTSTDLPSPRLHLVGDSTMADKVNLAYPERGWGQLLPEFMLPKLSIINHAANGRSTLRFLNEGRWQLLVTELKAGDYVLIQFGHNDQKQDDPSRYAAVYSTYPQLLRRFIAEVRAKDAIPMLATPICRRSFDDSGKLDNNLAEYAAAMRQVAVQEKVSLFDLNAQSCAAISHLGQSASQAFFIQVPAGLYQKFPEGKIDNTHLNTQGASWIAQMFVRELKTQQHPLAALVWRELL